jgi:hypothetical protein
MPKWVLYGFAAIADFVAAGLFFSRGRLILPAILTIAGMCFVAAAVGAAKGADKGTRDTV